MGENSEEKGKSVIIWLVWYRESFQARFKSGDSVKMSGVREFQSLGADRLKALDPMVVRLADGVKSWMVEEDRRVQEGVWMQKDEAPWIGIQPVFSVGADFDLYNFQDFLSINTRSCIKHKNEKMMSPLTVADIVFLKFFIAIMCHH